MTGGTLIEMLDIIGEAYEVNELDEIVYLLAYRKGSELVNMRIKDLRLRVNDIFFREYDTDRSRIVPIKSVVDILDFDKYFGLNGVGLVMKFTNKKIKTTWNSSNKKWLISKGYKFTKMYESIEINQEDLQPTSPTKVEVYCDKCNNIFCRERRRIKDNEECLCSNCAYKKVGENNIKKHCPICGKHVERPNKYNLCKECRKANIVTQYTKNRVEFIDNYAIIFFRNNKNEEIGSTIIDKEDYEKVKEYKWRLYSGYACSEPNIKLHRILMGVSDSNLEVDHINRNKLDNRKENLRVVTHKVNIENQPRRPLKYAKIEPMDFINFEGISTTIWVTMCPFCCPNCFNAKLRDPNYGNVFTDETYDYLKKSLENTHVDNLVLLGGEPFYNASQLLPIVRKLKEDVPNKRIVSFSGFTFEEILNGSIDMVNLLRELDILIDGKFVEELKDLTLKFRGSSNQEIVDINKSLKEGKKVLWKSEEM